MAPTAADLNVTPDRDGLDFWVVVEREDELERLREGLVPFGCWRDFDGYLLRQVQLRKVPMHEDLIRPVLLRGLISLQ
jgi:hypothetical protein